MGQDGDPVGGSAGDPSEGSAEHVAKHAAPEPTVEPASTPEPEPALVPESAPDAAGHPGEGAPESGRQRLKAALWPPRVSRAQLVVALLLFALGLGLAIQVRSTNSDTQLRGARQEDLVRLLDEVDARQQRLESDRQQLQQSLATLQNSSQQAKEAQIQTRTKEQQLGVLAGTVGATGPGIVLTINDPGGKVQADMLLNTLEELRAAGAEAVEINGVRVVAGTWFSDASTGAVTVGGKSVPQPYRFTVIGNAHDLATALGIPGGVVQSVAKLGASTTVSQQKSLAVTALIPLGAPDYAHSASP